MLFERPPNVGRRGGFATYRDIEPDYYGNIEPDFFVYDENEGAGGSWPLWAFHKVKAEFARRGSMADITLWGNVNMYERVMRLRALNNKVRELYGQEVS